MDLKSLFGSKPTAPLGNGLVGQSAAAMLGRPYQLHMQEAQTLGQQPMSPEQFAQMMAQGKPKGLLAE